MVFVLYIFDGIDGMAWMGWHDTEWDGMGWDDTGWALRLYVMGHAQSIYMVFTSYTPRLFVTDASNTT